uniref:Uncharacterized protein n=1 Tax=Rhizophora mucronata TaxID=61149 RepID=A0A2P2IZH6_RHIMU
MKQHFLLKYACRNLEILYIPVLKIK